MLSFPKQGSVWITKKAPRQKRNALIMFEYGTNYFEVTSNNSFFATTFTFLLSLSCLATAA
jgi:hypothetical protein